MTKQQNNSTASIDQEKNSCDKLRDELFEVRVDVKAYIRSLKILATSASIVLVILAFFGYNKIDTVQQTIINKANQRLASTDLLLSKIDQTHIDSLNKQLVKKQKEYELTLRNFELTLSKNKELENKLYNALTPNERTEYNIESWLIYTPQDYFEIKSIPDVFKTNDKINVYLTFSQTFDLKKAIVLRISLSQVKDSKNYGIRDYYYKVQQRLNKLSITLDVGKGNYIFEVGFIGKDKEGYKFYRLQKNIEII